jgi:hypothetical protein
MKFLEVPIGVGLISSVGVRIKDLEAPNVSLHAIGCQPPCGEGSTIGDSGRIIFRIKCWALFRGDSGSSCRLVVFLPLP